MENPALEIGVDLVGDKVMLSAATADDAPITIDYMPPLGDGKGYTPLELFLISLAACSGTTIITLLRRLGKEVAGFHVSSTGVRRDTHPTSFANIHLDFTVRSSNAVTEDMDKVLALTKEKFCPVWAMMNDSVEVTVSYHIEP